MQKALNLGFNLVDRVLREVQIKFTELEEKRVEKILGKSYQDYKRLKKIANRDEESKEYENGTQKEEKNDTVS